MTDPAASRAALRHPLAAALFAWAAGLAFVGSLAYFAYFYAVSLGRADRPPRLTGLGALLADAALFGAFALHHSALARSAAKRQLARWIPPVLERATYVWVASALFFAVCYGWQTIPGTLYRLHGGAALLGRTVQVAGLALIAIAVARLDPLELAGIRQLRGASTGPPSGAPDRSDEGLNIRGPYRLVRHPLYLGWILALGATPVMTADRVAFAAISSLYLLVAIPWEERALIATYGDAYRQYIRQVRWRILPPFY